MLYELILINEIEQRAKIIFLSVPHFLSRPPAIHFNKHLQVFSPELWTGIWCWTALGEENKSYCPRASALNSLFETMQIFMKH